MKAAFYTLGCKVNQYESQAMEELFRRGGMRSYRRHQEADLYIVNSCTVTSSGDKKTGRSSGGCAGNIRWQWWLSPAACPRPIPMPPRNCPKPTWCWAPGSAGRWWSVEEYLTHRQRLVQGAAP